MNYFEIAFAVIIIIQLFVGMYFISSKLQNETKDYDTYEVIAINFAITIILILVAIVIPGAIIYFISSNSTQLDFFFR